MRETNVEDDVRVAVVELAVQLIRPVTHLELLNMHTQLQPFSLTMHKTVRTTT